MKSKIKIKPLGARVLLSELPVPDVKINGIAIPIKMRQETIEGHVIAVGDEKLLEVKVGDRVILKDHTGEKISIDGKNYLIVNESDILGVLA